MRFGFTVILTPALPFESPTAASCHQVLRPLKKSTAQWVPYDFIIKTTSRLLIPFIQLFALYVIAHGHHSPGGGFQGGCHSRRHA